MADDRSDVIPNSDAEEFAMLARRLHRETSVEETLTLMCRLAASVIPGAAHAGITVIQGGNFSTPASNDSIPYEVDRIQYETGEGPCVEATRNAADVVESRDIRTSTGGPISEANADRDACAQHVVVQAVPRRGHPWCTQPVRRRGHSLGDRARQLGGTFAAHAAVAFGAAQADHKTEQLQTALITSRRIGQAMGILMSRRVVSEDAAFSLLREFSQHTQRKLRDIADEVVFTGDLPTE